MLTELDRDWVYDYLSELHVRQPRRCSTCGEGGGTFHGRRFDTSVDRGRLEQLTSEQRHAKAPRADTDSEYLGCVLSFPWRQIDQSRSWTQGTCSSSVANSECCVRQKGRPILLGATSMMIDFGENVAKRVLATVCFSAKSIMERRGTGQNSTLALSYALVFSMRDERDCFSLNVRLVLSSRTLYYCFFKMKQSKDKVQ